MGDRDELVVKIRPEIYIATFQALKQASDPDQLVRLNALEQAFKASNYTDKLPVWHGLIGMFNPQTVAQIMHKYNSELVQHPDQASLTNAAAQAMAPVSVQQQGQQQQQQQQQQQLQLQHMPQNMQRFPMQGQISQSQPQQFHPSQQQVAMQANQQAHNMQPLPQQFNYQGHQNIPEPMNMSQVHRPNMPPTQSQQHMQHTASMPNFTTQQRQAQTAPAAGLQRQPQQGRPGNMTQPVSQTPPPQNLQNGAMLPAEKGEQLTAALQALLMQQQAATGQGAVQQQQQQQQQAIRPTGPQATAPQQFRPPMTGNLLNAAAIPQQRPPLAAIAQQGLAATAGGQKSAGAGDQKAPVPGNKVTTILQSLMHNPGTWESALKVLEAKAKQNQAAGQDSTPLLNLCKLIRHSMVNKKPLLGAAPVRPPGGIRPVLPYPTARLPLSEDERQAQADAVALATLKAESAAAEQADDVQAAIKAVPFTPPTPKQAEYVLNELPTLELLTDLAKQHGLKAVSPSCFTYLAMAIEKHMIQVLTGMSRIAKQRHDPARDLPYVQRTGMNVRHGVGQIAKADKQARERRMQAEQEKRMALAQIKQKKKMDEESKELVKKAKEEQNQKKLSGQASAALGQAFSFKKQKASRLGGGATKAGATDTPAATTTAPAVKGLRGTLAAKLKGGSGLGLGKKDPAAATAASSPAAKKEGTVKKEGDAKEPPRPKKKLKPNPEASGKATPTPGDTGSAPPASAPAAGTSNLAKSSSMPDLSQGTRVTPSAVGTNDEDDTTDTAAGGKGIDSGRSQTPEPVGDGAAAAGTRDKSMGSLLPRRAADGEKKVVELTAKDLLVVLEKDLMLSKQRAVWKVYGGIAL